MVSAIESREVTMSREPDCTRRWLINASGASILANAVSANPSYGQATVEASRSISAASTGERTADHNSVSPITTALADYVARTFDRELPAPVIARTKLHVLDTLAAMVSGSRLKPGEFAARYVDSLGGKPQAMVIGTGVVTSAVNAALANAMAAHADETDDTNPVGPFHAGCGVVSAALATAELTGRTGNDVLRAVALGYDIGARLVISLAGTRRHSPSCVTTTFAAAATSAAMLRLDHRQVRHVFSYAGQQASGIGYWDRDLDHIEKAFDFGGMGARNGVMAATMVALGFTGVEDPFSGGENVFTALADTPKPQELIAELGMRFEVFNTTIKKWSVGSPLQSVLDSVAALLEDPAVRAGNIRHIAVDIPTESLRIVDNSTIPDLCLQHLVALMIADGGVTFASVHDVARMRDPKILAIRNLVEVVPSAELQAALPRRQAIVRIETGDGRMLNHRTYVVRGTARNPMDPNEVEAKALDLMAPVLGAARAKELIGTVADFDRVGPVSGLRRLLQA
jgi:2-methylcitrate dehydratase PrpD